MLTEVPVIATSIMPRRVEAQQAAIASWVKLGFRVLSVNSPGEVDTLHESFPEVRFVTVATGSSPGPHIPLGEIFTALAESGCTVCGIVNSDICFTVEEDFRRYIATQAVAGVIFGSRVDLFPGQVQEKEYSFGFDYFFFPGKILSYYPPTGFGLGKPLWDYWFPLVALCHGFKVQRLLTPVAVHRHHDASWGEPMIDAYWRILHSGLADLKRMNVAAEFSPLLSRLMGCDWRKGSWLLLQVLRYQTVAAFYPHGNKSFRTVAIHQDSFSAMLGDLEASRRMLAETQGQLAAVHASRSWRLTAPLRSMKAILTASERT